MPDEDKSSTQKTCFIITPIGSDGSIIRRAANGLIDSVISPVMKELDFRMIVPHKLADPGSITVQVVNHIVDDDMVIANLTGLRPNVMYELALRHSAMKPVVIMAELGTVLPFDISHDRVVFFTNDMAGVMKARKDLQNHVKMASSGKQPDNPIYIARKTGVIKEISQKDIGSINDFIIGQLNNLQSRMNHLVHSFESVKASEYISKPNRVVQVSGSFSMTLHGSMENIEQAMDKLLDEASYKYYSYELEPVEDDLCVVTVKVNGRPSYRYIDDLLDQFDVKRGETISE